MSSLSILMPVYNELRTVDAAITEVLSTDLPVDDVELVIVDDGSTDGTRELLRDMELPEAVKLVMHESNRGKGAAIRTALEHAGCDYAAIMDADLEYEPADLGRVLEPLLSGDAQVVYGTRGFESHSSYSFWYVMGNKAVTLAANVLFDRWLADVMTCHKAMPTSVWRSLGLTANGFAIEPEITGRVLALGYQIYEVPIRYRARTRQEGKKLTAADGLRSLAMLVRCRLRAGHVQPRPSLTRRALKRAGRRDRERV
jgi:glycosyltransferase involved in cell wall biosynthesis